MASIQRVQARAVTAYSPLESMVSGVWMVADLIPQIQHPTLSVHVYVSRDDIASIQRVQARAVTADLTLGILGFEGLPMMDLRV